MSLLSSNHTCGAPAVSSRRRAEEPTDQPHERTAEPYDPYRYDAFGGPQYRLQPIARRGLTKVAKKRITKELSNHVRDAPAAVSWKPRAEDLQYAEGIIQGPSDTPFEGGVFYLNIVFPNDYPFNPPRINFTTPIYHPNIDSDGCIGFDLLREGWCTACTIEMVLISIMSILGDPLDGFPAMCPEKLELYQRDGKWYEGKARDWTRKYAKWRSVMSCAGYES